VGLLTSFDGGLFPDGIGVALCLAPDVLGVVAGFLQQAVHGGARLLEQFVCRLARAAVARPVRNRRAPARPG
jgi:hypothetical protein